MASKLTRVDKSEKLFNITVLWALLRVYRFCFSGESFAGSVDKRRLAIDVKDIVKKMWTRPVLLHKIGDLLWARKKAGKDRQKVREIYLLLD